MPSPDLDNYFQNALEGVTELQQICAVCPPCRAKSVLLFLSSSDP